MDSQPAIGAPPGAPPLPALPVDIQLPQASVLLDTDKPFIERLKIIFAQFRAFFSSIKAIFLLPIGWFFTFAHSALHLLKVIWLLPLTIFINIYERRIRAWFPKLPSIWLIMNLLFPSGIRLPSFRDITELPGLIPGSEALKANLPTLNIDLDAIRNGNTDEIANSISGLKNSVTNGQAQLSGLVGLNGLKGLGGAK